MVIFIEPTSRALGPDGGKFMNYMMTVRRYPMYASAAAGITILAGFVLFGITWGPVWNTPRGLTFLAGGIVSLVAIIFGGAIVGRSATAMTQIAGEIAKQGKPPSHEQMTQVRALQEQLRSGGVWTAILVSIALLAMAVARYVPQ